MVKRAPSAAPQLATCALSGGVHSREGTLAGPMAAHTGLWSRPTVASGPSWLPLKSPIFTSLVRPGELVTMHGWQPVVRGGCEVASKFEGGTMSFGRFLGNMKREICDGEKLSVGW